MSQNYRGARQDKADISTPELIPHMLPHMLVVEDGLSRPSTSQRNKLWRRVLTAVLCGALVVTIVSDLSLLLRHQVDAVLERNNNTKQ